MCLKMCPETNSAGPGHTEGSPCDGSRSRRRSHRATVPWDYVIDVAKRLPWGYWKSPQGNCFAGNRSWGRGGKSTKVDGSGNRRKKSVRLPLSETSFNVWS